MLRETKLDRDETYYADATPVAKMTTKQKRSEIAKAVSAIRRERDATHDAAHDLLNRLEGLRVLAKLARKVELVDDFDTARWHVEQAMQYI